MSTMTADEMRAVVSVAVMAAFADGRKHEREREELRRIADGLAQDEAVHLPSLVQDVLMGRVSLTSVAPRLRADTARQLAYEMAVCVCDADGAQSAAERDFLATVGVGLTSQYLEQAGRKLLGGLLGKVGGGLLAGVGRQAVSSGMSFVTTYALGHVARRYYAGGRLWTTAMLKDAYQDMTRRAQGLQQRHLPEIRERARGLDAAKVMALVRGGPAA